MLLLTPLGLVQSQEAGIEEMDEIDMAELAVDETVILPHPPLPSVGVSTGMERGCRQIDSLADG